MISKTNVLLDEVYLTKDQLNAKFSANNKKIHETYVNIEDNDKYTHKEWRDKGEMKDKLNLQSVSIKDIL